VQSRGVYCAWSVGSVLLRGLLCGAGLSAASLAFQGSHSLLAGGESFLARRRGRMAVRVRVESERLCGRGKM